MTTYAPGRPVMTSAELSTNHVASYGRDYSESDDGYSDMEAEQARGWHVISGWGRDGWDLGDWPYVMVYTRNAGDAGSLFVVGRPNELMTICEGDRSTYAFEYREDRTAAIDYLFLWYAAGQDWAPLSYEDRAKLDAGELTVDEKFRGPYRPQGEPVAPVNTDPVLPGPVIFDPDGPDLPPGWQTWQSPNGVGHAIDPQGRCVTCGNPHPCRTCGFTGCEGASTGDCPRWPAEPVDCSGAWDGFQVISDADPGL